MNIGTKIGIGVGVAAIVGLIYYFIHPILPRKGVTSTQSQYGGKTENDSIIPKPLITEEINDWLGKK